jgi:hypothetical protein
VQQVPPRKSRRPQRRKGVGWRRSSRSLDEKPDNVAHPRSSIRPQRGRDLRHDAVEVHVESAERVDVDTRHQKTRRASCHPRPASSERLEGSLRAPYNDRHVLPRALVRLVLPHLLQKFVEALQALSELIRVIAHQPDEMRMTKRGRDHLEGGADKWDGLRRIREPSRECDDHRARHGHADVAVQFSRHGCRGGR